MSGNNLEGQTLKGHYEIKEYLGGGTFGDTYFAFDIHKLNEICVVKKLKYQNQDPKLIPWVKEKFEQEAQMLQKLGTHPQIPNLLAYFQDQQDFFIVQEYIEGDALRTQFNSGIPWNPNQVSALLRDILEVLAFVHQHNVIHRDIKPDNIIIRRQDHKIVLIDFGAVKQINPQINSQGKITSPTLAVGTQGYMPMEQVQGTPALCSDVYAVGMIGIEALTGIHASQIQMNNSQDVWCNKAPQVSNEFAAVLDKMVCFDTGDRYQSASEALIDVRNLITTAPPPPPPPPPPDTEKYAGFSMRLVADIIDKTILIVASIICDFITQAPTNDDAEFLGRILGAYIVLGFVYCPVMDSSNWQGTLGKKLLGISVTDINGNKLTFEQATKRHSSKLLSYLTLFIGFSLAGWTKRKQALHDKICKTLVVRK
jgi:serine/threonine protein kinase